MNYSIKANSPKSTSIIVRNLFFILSLLIGTGLFAQETTDEKIGIFEFENEVLDYGTIAHKSDGVRAFKFTNVGDAPIVITKVKGSCGCTVPTKPEGPIMPGESAEIGVKYATDRIGTFAKTVTVTSNASKASIQLKIKGNVLNSTEKEEIKSN